MSIEQYGMIDHAKNGMCRSHPMTIECTSERRDETAFANV
jgi:hypothetical protein